MDRDTVARKLHALGKREAAALHQLSAVAAERCALLTSLVPEAGLSADAESEVVEPKDENP